MWYVIWTLTGKENMLIGRIQSDLPDELYRRCWSPVRMERQKHKGELIDVEKILFPGYVFIDTDTPEEVEQEVNSSAEQRSAAAIFFIVMFSMFYASEQ